MNILIWATTFGGDLWSLTKYLDKRDDTTIKLFVDNPKIYNKEGVASLFPLKAEIFKRHRFLNYYQIPFYKPDVTIIDNRVPFRIISPKGFVLWHGFGWKGPNDLKEFKNVHLQLKRAWGDTMQPNPNFRWQCFGLWDFEHRTKISGFHPENCRILGAASHDDLRQPMDRKYLQHLYPFDIIHRQTILIAPTWHYGEVFAHWGTDADLFDRLITFIDQRKTNVILRMHDSFRFPKSYRGLLKKLEKDHPNLIVKFRDKNPDNYIDMQSADVLITNFSSIANLFYATKRPTIHIYPVKNADEEFMWRRCTKRGIVKQKIDSVRYIWKLPPEDNGGLIVYNFDELLTQIDRALEDPDCCNKKAQEFLDRHMLGADGKTCERIWDSLKKLVYG
ncbi:MAG: CDP-glycerol glycerophosphotransferase family protein [bacterium]